MLDQQHLGFSLSVWEERIKPALRFTSSSMVCVRPSINQSYSLLLFFLGTTAGTACPGSCLNPWLLSVKSILPILPQAPPPPRHLPPSLPEKGPSELVLLMYSQTKLGALTLGEVRELVAAMHWIKDTISDSNQIRAHTHTCKSPLSNQFYKGPSAEIH